MLSTEILQESRQIQDTVRLGKVKDPHLVHQNKCNVHRILLSVHALAIATVSRYGTVQSVGP
jgi:hypothetical protein